MVIATAKAENESGVIVEVELGRHRVARHKMLE